MVGQRAVTPWLRQVGSIPTSPTKFLQKERTLLGSYRGGDYKQQDSSVG